MAFTTRLTGMAAAAAIVAAGGASAATRTIDFTVSDFSTVGYDYNAGQSDNDRFFELLGFGTLDTISVTGTFTFDTGADPLRGPEGTNADGEPRQVWLPYKSFSIEITDGTDSLILEAPEIPAGSTSTWESLHVEDNGGSNGYNDFYVISDTNQTLSPGVTSWYFYAQAWDYGIFDGLDVPSVAELNALDSYERFLFYLRDTRPGENGYGRLDGRDITWSESTAVVPLPAGLPLLLTGLAAIAWVSRRSTA